MAKASFRLALLLNILFVVGVTLPQLQPYDDSALRSIFVSSEDCVLPCWQGIRPGLTSGVEAIALLQTNPWVNYLRVRGDLEAGAPGTITWSWSGMQPTHLAGSTGGRLLVMHNIVQYVRFSTTLQFGDIWMGYDHPEAGLLTGPNSPATQQQIFHQASFHDGKLMVESTLTCPMKFGALWYTPVTVELRQEMRLLPLVEYRLAQWMLNTPC
jgi:hypothetical protein